MFIVYHCLSRFGISTTVIHDEFMIFLTVNSRVVLVWSFFSFSTIPSNSHRGWEIRKVLCWIRNRESLILDKKNRKVLSWKSKPKSLPNACSIFVQCLLNVCAMSHMSAQCLFLSNFGFFPICFKIWICIQCKGLEYFQT